MNNTHKVIIGLALVIAVLGGAYVNRPKIEVKAEATANATSTVIVPTSTKTVVTQATTTPDVAPSTVYIYKTYVESNGETKEETKPVIEPVKVEPTIYVPTPVYTTTYAPMLSPVIEPVSQPVVQPIVSSAPVVDPTPVIESPFYSEYPHYWIEERNNGRWIFFQATWSDGSKGKIMCNGKGQSYVVSGLPSIVEEKNLADQITGGSLVAEDRYVSCTFSVGDNGGVTASIVVK